MRGVTSGPDDELPFEQAAGVFRHYTYYRPAILILLKERESHGYDLASRLTEMGFDPRVSGSLYGVLRAMESEALVVSSWDLSKHRGPPRRVYSLAEAGDRYLGEVVPVLTRQRNALGVMLARYSVLTPDNDSPARRVQMVGGDQQLLSALNAVLEESGCLVSQTTSPTDVSDSWPGRSADMVVLDRRVEGVDGIEIARQLRRHDYQGPIVLLSDEPIAPGDAHLEVHTVPRPDFSGFVDALSQRR